MALIALTDGIVEARKLIAVDAPSSGFETPTYQELRISSNSMNVVNAINNMNASQPLANELIKLIHPGAFYGFLCCRLD